MSRSRATTRPVRPARPRTGAALTALLSLLSLVLWAGPSPGSAAARLPSEASGPPARQIGDEVTVRGTSQTSWVDRDGTWSLGLVVEGAPAGARVEAALHARITDTETFYLALFGVVDGARRAGIPDVDLADASPAPGGGRELTLAVGLRQDHTPSPGWAFLSDGLRTGVYPILIQVLDADGEELVRTVAFLTRVPSDGETGSDADPLLVAPVLPLDLAEEPADDTDDTEGDDEDDTGTGEGQDPSGSDPTPSSTEARGDQGEEGDDGTTTTDDPRATNPDDPADPDTTGDPDDPDDPTRLDPDALERAAERIDVVAEGLLASPALPATLLPRPRLVEALSLDPEHSEILRTLRRAGRGRQVVDGTFVEIALPAWISADLTEELARQREWGNVALTQGLGVVDSSTWHATTGLTPEALTQLWEVGVRSVLMPPGGVEDASSTRPFTLDAGAARTVRAAEVHESLSIALTRRGDPILDESAFAAELALTAQSADGPAGVVVAPAPAWPSDEAAVTRLGDILLDDRAPVRPVSVSALLDGVDPSGTPSLATPPPVDLGAWPDQLALARSRISSFAGLAPAAGDEVAELDRRLLVSGDTALTTDERVDEADLVVEEVDESFAAIEAPDRQTITLTARDGRLPLTLRNQLDVPATVAIDLDADGRIDLPDGERMVVELEPGTNQIDIPVHTRIPGDVPVDIMVRTPDSAVTLDEVRYTVRSTAVSGLGLVLSIGAAAFLLLWWARHWTRSRRAKHQPSHPSAGPGPAPADDRA